MSFEVDPLTERDVEEAARVLFQSLGKQAASILKDANTARNVIYGPHAITLTAKKKGKIIGVVSGTATDEPTVVFLGVVDEESAVQGLGAILLEKFTDYVAKQFPSVRAVRTALAADFPEAIALYSSKGFVIEGFVKSFHAAQGRDMVFLKKHLARP